MEREKVYTEEEAAKFLGVSTYAVRERYREGVLPALRKGKRSRLYFEADLIALRDSGKALKLRKSENRIQAELMVPAQQFREAAQELGRVSVKLEKAERVINAIRQWISTYSSADTASTIELKGE